MENLPVRGVCAPGRLANPCFTSPAPWRAGSLLFILPPGLRQFHCPLNSE